MPSRQPARHIESASNPFIKETARLKERRGRQRSGLMLVEGLREAERALAAGVAPLQLLVAPELVAQPERVEALRQAASHKGGEVLTLALPAFSHLSLRQQPDGVILVGRSQERRPGDVALSPRALVLILDGLEKPGNLGALLRTADAVGADALFVTGSGAEGGGTDLDNPNVIRASMGSVFSVRSAGGSRDEVADVVKAAGLRLIATSPDGADARSMWDTDLTGGVALLLGAEHAGLPAWWSDRADGRVTIPMRAQAADSLNVSVAGAVLLYEAWRQRT